MIGSVRIEPSMDENAAFVCLGNQKRQRIEGLPRPHLPGQKLRPRLELRCVNGIRHRTHLKDNGIEP